MYVLLRCQYSNLSLPHSVRGSVDARQRIVQQMVENVEAFKAGWSLAGELKRV